MQIQHFPTRKSDLRHVLALLTADYIARGNAVRVCPASQRRTV